MRGKRHERVSRDGSMRLIVAICDKELLGRTLKQGEVVLDLEKYSSFYDGVSLSEEEAVSWIKSSRNLNLVGVKAVKAAKTALKVSASSVKKIQGVPHLQVYYV